MSSLPPPRNPIPTPAFREPTPRNESMNHNINVADPHKSKFVERLTHSITEKLDTVHVGSYNVCIYRVSKKHRIINEEAYTPRLVSIGPLHHGKSHLQAMEAVKWRRLKSFKSGSGINIEKLVILAAEEESYVRGFYEDVTQFTSEKFTEIILLDGIFIVDQLLKNEAIHMRTQDDINFENQWMSRDILHDMLLLENQLPISFIDKLLWSVKGSYSNSKTIFDYTLEYFKDVGHTKEFLLTSNCKNARHFVELLLYLHESSGKTQEGASLPGRLEYTKSASELQEAGVRFKARTGHYLLDASFSDGVLIIHPIKLTGLSETFFRNLIAFEQCGHHSKNITSYIIFMDSLINTPTDVDILSHHGIIDNSLGDSQQVADLFNNLYKEILPHQSQFYFAKTCEELNNYSKDYLHEWKSRWFKWKAILRSDYFSNPWSAISLFAAFLLLALSTIQAVCSVISVKQSP